MGMNADNNDANMIISPVYRIKCPPRYLKKPETFVVMFCYQRMGHSKGDGRLTSSEQRNLMSREGASIKLLM
jgi:hypothetical protein